MVLDISANDLAALDADVIFSEFISVTASEKPLRPLPSVGNLFANLARLLSPVNQATIPPSLGMVLVISVNDLAALDADVIFSEFIPATESEKPLRPLPSIGKSFPNLAILFSPANQPTTPPSLGIFLVISVNDLAALDAAVTFSVFIPATESENPLRPLPSKGNSFPNLAMLFSPANHPTTPPSLGITAVIWANAFAALEATITFSAFIPSTASENPLRPLPSKGNSETYLETDDPPPGNKLANVFIMLALANTIMASAIFFIPVVALESTLPKVFIKVCILEAIAGNVAAIPNPIPPIIPPINKPKPVPIF